MPRALSRSTSSSAPGELRRQRDQAHSPRGEQPLEQCGIGVAPRRLAVRAEPGGGEERPFQVNAEDARPGRPLRDGSDRREEVALLRRDQRGEVRRDSGLEECLAGDREALGVRAEEVDTREAVHLQVDEARHRDPAAGAVEADGLDPASVDRDVAGNETPVDERGLDAEPHGSSAFRTTPPACASRARAFAASTSASSITIATFASPSEASSAAAT